MTPNPTPRDGPLRAVVFDLDGLLIDTEATFAEAARRVLAGRGLTLEPAFFVTMMGTPGRDALPRFIARYNLTDPLPVIADEYKRHFLAALNGTRPPLMPGTVELL